MLQMKLRGTFLSIAGHAVFSVFPVFGEETAFDQLSSALDSVQPEVVAVVSAASEPVNAGSGLSEVEKYAKETAEKLAPLLKVPKKGTREWDELLRLNEKFNFREESALKLIAGLSPRGIRLSIENLLSMEGMHGMQLNNCLSPGMESYVINSREELDSLVRVLSGDIPPEDAGIVSALLKLQKKGFLFYEQGVTSMLGLFDQNVTVRTGPLGEYLALKSGKKTVIVGKYGMELSVDNFDDVMRVAVAAWPDEFQLDQLKKSIGRDDLTHAQVARALNVINKAEVMGLQLAPDYSKPPYNIPNDLTAITAKPPPLSRDRMILMQKLLAGEEVRLWPAADVMRYMSRAAATGNIGSIRKLLSTYGQSARKRYETFSGQLNALKGKGVVIMTRFDDGPVAGALRQGSDQALYGALLKDSEIVLLYPDGSLVSISSFKELSEYASGQVPAKAVFNQEYSPKNSLILAYVAAPFDAKAILGYDASILEAMKVGSNDNADIVFFRSDLPDKRNLLFEHVEKGGVSTIREENPDTLLNDPGTLENFLIESIRRFPRHKNIRLFISGHGGAEKGLLPDGKTNDAGANGAMPVDEFAKAIRSALTRIEEETGLPRKIDNIVIISCLMGNSSFIYALSKEGKVEALNASPEVLTGNVPRALLEYAASDGGSAADAREFSVNIARKMVEAPVFNSNGESSPLHFANIAGAYDLSSGLLNELTAALKYLAERLIRNKELLRPAYLSKIDSVPRYGRDPAMQMMEGFFGKIEERDVALFAGFVKKVASGASGLPPQEAASIISAADRLTEASRKITLYQAGNTAAFEVSYDDPVMTLYVPDAGSEVKGAMLETEFMRKSGFADFIREYYPTL